MAIIGVILLVLVAVFTLENRAPVTVMFLGWRYDTLLSYAMLAPLLLGAVVLYLAGLVRHRELRARLRAAEQRANEAERQRAAFSTEPRSGAGEPPA